MHRANNCQKLLLLTLHILKLVMFLKIKHLELPEGVFATAEKETVVASCLLSGQKLEDASDIHTEVVESNNE
jgi:hypothetical protein